MTKLSKILDMYPDDGYIKADGFDTAVIGVSTSGCLVYDVEIMLEILMERNGWSYEDAVEYFDNTIDGAYVGERTPIYVNLIKN